MEQKHRRKEQEDLVSFYVCSLGRLTSKINFTRNLSRPIYYFKWQWLPNDQVAIEGTESRKGGSKTVRATFAANGDKLEETEVPK